MHGNLFDLGGKTALITGGNSGIGFGFAEGVAKHGADVCIWEVARYGVTANSILPGHVATAMTARNYANEKFANAILPRIPLRRWGDKSDFEGIAVYLMSDASAYHTGDSFLIDGGFFMF
jgi:NAD(P)-dependent dehydrogenase (short-subunit alcohol dehydrogenase family)